MTEKQINNTKNYMKIACILSIIIKMQINKLLIVWKTLNKSLRAIIKIYLINILSNCN